MTRNYHRRSKKAKPNTIILVVAVVVALLASSSFGVKANNMLTTAIISSLILAFILAGVLSWLVYRSITLRQKRQEAVTSESVDSMSWKDFELFVMQLLKSQGFTIKQYPSGPGDQGADIIAAKGRDKYAIQVKHYSKKLDNTPVQEAVAAKAHYKCNRAMAVTNSHFTTGAILLAATNNCVLVDREKLGEWILAN